tara:strand:+ start:5548 stop:6768 length:1221 start_codon:yes stop_codon:yes gene_type:complete
MGLITTKATTQVADFLIGTNIDDPSHVDFGTGTTAPVRGDTAMETSKKRKEGTFTRNDMVVNAATELYSTDTETYGSSITETGTFDAASDGNMYDHNVFVAGVTHNNVTDIKVTKFFPVDNTGLPSRTFLTDQMITEVGEFLKDDTGTAPTHIALGTHLILEQCDAVGSWTDDSSDATTPTLSTSQFKEGTGSLNMGKDGTSTTTFKYNITIASAKSTANGTQFRVWFRVDDQATVDKFASSGGLKFRIGSDSSNYKEASFDRADIIVGWKKYTMNIADMTTTGSPDTANTDFLEAFMTLNNASDTITHALLNMDYWHVQEDLLDTDTALFGEIVRQSATRSLNNNKAKFETTIALATGNTYRYAQTGLFDTSSGGNMTYVQEFNDIVKDSATKLIQTIEITVNPG